MEVLLTAEQIEKRVVELARRIADDYRGRPLTIVGVLTGSLIFLADLIRRIDVPLKIGLIQASSYRGAVTRPGELTINAELLPDLRGRHVLLLDDILDTGRTISRMVEHLRTVDTLSVKTVVLARKRARQEIAFEPDYVGFEVPDAFIVGYGLDYNDEYRHLPYIAILNAEQGM
jgi:hypoxanthine phosphoribosyltransferase